MAFGMSLGTHKTSLFTETNPLSNLIQTKVCFHSTLIVVFDSEKITLDNGGWYTPTTKKRMNQASSDFSLGFKVYQKNYEWYCEYQGKIHSFTQNKLVLDRVGFNR